MKETVKTYDFPKGTLVKHFVGKTKVGYTVIINGQESKRYQNIGNAIKLVF